MQIFVKSLGGPLIALECSDSDNCHSPEMQSKVYQEFVSKAYPCSASRHHRRSTYLHCARGTPSNASVFYIETGRLLGGASGTADHLGHPATGSSSANMTATTNESASNPPNPVSSSSFATLSAPALSSGNNHAHVHANASNSGGSHNSGSPGNVFGQPVFPHSSPAFATNPYSSSSAAPSSSLSSQPLFMPVSQPISIPMASSSKPMSGASGTTTMFGTFSNTIEPGLSTSASSSLSNSLSHSLGSAMHRKAGGSKHKCTLDGCADRAVKIIGDCRYCDGHYCSIHRLPEAHSCSNIQNCRQESFDKNSVKLMGEKCVADKV